METLSVPWSEVVVVSSSSSDSAKGTALMN